MSSVHRLSKSKLISGWQCARRLWLEVHARERATVSAVTEQLFATGHEVGAAAQTLFPDGILIGHDRELDAALKDTDELLRRPGAVTLFEAAFRHDDVLIRADVLERDAGGNLRLIEVKASTKLKDYHVTDCAIQLYVLRGASGGLTPDITVELAHINNAFVYQGDGNYRNLLTYVDVTDRARKLQPQIPGLIDQMRVMLGDAEPDTEPGRHCTNPFDCPFIAYCAPQTTDYPIGSLPGSTQIKQQLVTEGFADIRDIPVGRLTNETQEWVRRVTKAGQPELDPAAARSLLDLPHPRYYLDFETVGLAVPIWRGTRPYQNLPFQWSCHIQYEDGQIEHAEFLADGRDAPMRAFAESLIEALGDCGPIMVYSAFERRVLKDMAQRFPDLKEPLKHCMNRLYDLLPLTRGNYYHPDMHGSWSIKAVLPTIAPDLSFDEVGEVTEGMAASAAFRSLLNDEQTADRRETIRQALRDYCALDTLAMVRLAAFLQAPESPELHKTSG